MALLRAWTEVEQVAACDGAAKHFFQAQGLGTELHMVIEPCAHFTFLVLDGRQLPLLFFNHIGKTGEAQALRPDPDSSMRRDVADTGRDPAVAARVTHGALNDVGIIEEFTQSALIIEPARAIF